MPLLIYKRCKFLCERSSNVNRARPNNEVTTPQNGQAGDEFPPLVVFHVDNDHLLADGFHRFLADKKNKRTDCPAQTAIIILITLIVARGGREKNSRFEIPK